MKLVNKIPDHITIEQILDVRPQISSTIDGKEPSLYDMIVKYYKNCGVDSISNNAYRYADLYIKLLKDEIIQNG